MDEANIFKDNLKGGIDNFSKGLDYLNLTRCKATSTCVCVDHIFVHKSVTSPHHLWD